MLGASVGSAGEPGDARDYKVARQQEAHGPAASGVTGIARPEVRPDGSRVVRDTVAGSGTIKGDASYIGVYGTFNSAKAAKRAENGVDAEGVNLSFRVV